MTLTPFPPWSGKSFRQTDEGNRLSYDLARKITALAARDEPSFRAFVAEAMMQDGGVSAEHHLGYRWSSWWKQCWARGTGDPALNSGERVSKVASSNRRRFRSGQCGRLTLSPEASHELQY